jgi:hypothetical protein
MRGPARLLAVLAAAVVAVVGAVPAARSAVANDASSGSRRLLQATAPGDAPLVPDPTLPLWSSPPVYMGCYHDHDPKAGGMNHAKPPTTATGPRLLRFGVPGCSGSWGCAQAGSASHVKSCLPWPSSVPSCDGKKMTQAYCVQMCSGWHDSYVYSSTAYAVECWCDSAMQNPDGLDRGLGLASDCSMPCKGSATEQCGGFWFSTVFSSDTPGALAEMFIATIMLG